MIAVITLSACSSEDAPVEKVAVVATPSEGELLVKKNCKVCHAQGLNGAPIIGNKKMWAPRLAQDEATLIQHATEGYGLMPAKGGNVDLTDAEIALAVKYLISQVK